MNEEKNIKQKEILDKLLPNPHGILLLAPRFGKTKLTIDILNRDNPKKILWVTPNAKLRDEDIPKEILEWSGQKLLDITSIICWASLNQATGFYDTIILDEYQYITEDNSFPLLSKNLHCNNIICLSGTHPKDKIKQQILNRLKLRVLHSMSIEEAVDTNMIADYEVEIVQCYLNSEDKNVKAGNKAKPFYITEKAQYEYLTKQIDSLKERGYNTTLLTRLRMHFIYKSSTKEFIAKELLKLLSNQRNFIFCSNIEQAERLGNGNTYHSKTNDKKLNEFINEEIDELYCVKAGGVGYTYRNVDNFIIIQSDSDNNGLTTQKLCRSLVEQGNYKAKIWFIVLRETVDFNWLSNTLQRFNSEKIKYTNIDEIKSRN